jgi:hypothetical protein
VRILPLAAHRGKALNGWSIGNKKTQTTYFVKIFDEGESFTVSFLIRNDINPFDGAELIDRIYQVSNRVSSSTADIPVQTRVADLSR